MSRTSADVAGGVGVVTPVGATTPLTGTTPLKVAFYARINQKTGYAAASRAYIHALHRVGVDVAVVDLDAELAASDPLIASLMGRRRFEPDFHLVHYLPHAASPLALYADRVIVSTVWEADPIPQGWVNVLSRVREVWVPCEHNVAAFQARLNRPVFKWPHALPAGFCGGDAICDASRLPPLDDRDFVFYSVFVWQERKNPLGIIAAFSRAFPPHTPHVRLVLKILGGPPPDQLEALLGPARATIDVIDEDWTAAQMEALARRGTCYVSLHRGEGWCYPLFEAACRGSLVIATNHSGPLEYLTADEHGLVESRLIDIDRPDRAGFDRGMRWADPDLDHAAQLMRDAVAQHDLAARKAQRAAQRLRRQYSLEAIGEAARIRLEQLRASPPEPPS
jgi:glycosyltransferase involved in cell wall biosynthesis